MKHDRSDLLAALVRLVARAPEAHVVVVGDAMLDEFVSGTVERTSPEAPVPVLCATTVAASPGGAANAARQVAALGGEVSLIAALGDDAAGRELLRGCTSAGVAVGAVHVDPDAETVRKQRFLAGRHQLVRVDWEREVPELPLDHLERSLESIDRASAIIISDYAKGAIGPDAVEAVCRHAARWGAPVLVDPKSTDLSIYRGATLLKANRVEMEAATAHALDPDDPVAVGAIAARVALQHGFEAVVTTLGEHGMVVVGGDGPPLHLAPSPQEVFDVSGAGDTVIAVLALAMATGESLRTSAQLASEAAGAVVRRAGVAVAHAGDLAAAVARRVAEVGAADRSDLLDQVRAWRLQGKRIVFTNGCFDLLHAGHVHLLQEAAAMGDVLVVGVNSDRSVRDLKGEGRPHIAEAERVALLEAIGCVDAVAVFDAPDPVALIEAVLPDVLVKGADYEPTEILGADIVARHGGEVATVELLPGRSTTSTVAEIQGRRAEEAPVGR